MTSVTTVTAVRVLRGTGLGVRHVGREIGWWLMAGWRLVRWAPRRLAAWVTGVGFAVWADVWWLLTVLLTGLVGLVVWARGWPGSFERRVAHPAWRRRTARAVRHGWVRVMEACGLARRVTQPSGVVEWQTPTLARVRWQDPDVLVTVPRLLVGQTVDDVVAVSERLRVAVGSRQIRVIPNDAHTGCTVRFLFADPLAEVIYADLPQLDAVANIDQAVLGITEDGSPWVVDLRCSRLTGGKTGSGKGGVMHGTCFALAPAVKAGLVRLNGIDLKGGMELAMSKPMFTRYTTDLAEAVVILEDEVRDLERRATMIAGKVRTHTPTVEEPLSITIIDELARMTAYATDPKLMKRADAAMRSILTGGRAPGYLIHAFVQDPRKDTVPQRHLFHEFTGLRLSDREEVVMIFQEGAVAAGVACHKIPRSTPGIGYALDEHGQVTRFRVGHVTDDMIRAVAERFPAPRHIPVTLPADNAPEPPAPRPRSPRKPRAPRDGADHD